LGDESKNSVASNVLANYKRNQGGSFANYRTDSIYKKKSQFKSNDFILGRRTSQKKKEENDSFERDIGPSNKHEATSDYLRDEFDFNHDDEENQLRGDFADILVSRKKKNKSYISKSPIN